MADGVSIGKAYVQIVPSAKGLGGAISKELNGEAASAGKSAGGSLMGSLGGALKAGAGIAAAAVGAASAAVTGFAKEAVSSYASYEQLVGGVETLYGNAYNSVEEYAEGVGVSLDFAQRTWEQYQNRQEDVMKNANNAYITAGMSANDYMETVTSFAASLNNSLGEYAWQSANYADMAVGDMADNANKMGTSMDSIQNAYQGFAKGNFTMLDNLKLGYGGTKTEMERLLEKAEELEGLEEGALDINSFADIVYAIHTVQENLGITGTTAEEAMKTIEGSANATKAAWANVITAIGRGEGISEAFNQLTTALFGENEGEGFLANIIPRIQTTMEGIGEFIVTAAPLISDKIPALIESIVPSLLSSAVTMIDAIGQGINAALPALLPVASNVILQLIGAFTDNMPMFVDTSLAIIETLVNSIIEATPMMIEGAIELLAGLASGIGEMLPTLIPAAVEMLVTIVQGLIENMPMLIEGAIQLVTGLAEGIAQALPLLVEQIPTMMVSITQAIIDNAPMLVQAIIECIPLLLEAVVQITVAIVQGIIGSLGTLLGALGEVISGLVSRIGESAGEFVAQVAATGSQVIAAFGQWLSQLPFTLAYWAAYGVTSFIKFYIELPGKIASLLSQAISAVASFGVEFAQKAVEAARNFFNSLMNGIQSLPSKLRSLGQQLVGALKDLPDKFLSIGSDIVKGIWNGISEGWKWLTEKVAKLADSLVQGVKDALGIESPSKVFAAEVGRWIPAGIAVGIEDNTGILSNTIGRVTDEMLGSMNLGTIGAVMRPAFADGYYGASSGFNQEINIYAPTELTPSEIARQTKNATRATVLALRGK